MPILVSFALGSVLWIALWAIDIKALDAFMATILFTLIGTIIHMTIPYARKYLSPHE